MSGMSPHGHHMSPQDYDYAPQITLEPPSVGSGTQHYPPSNSVPNVLQPGGPSSRSNAPNLSTAAQGALSQPAQHHQLHQQASQQQSPSSTLHPSQPSSQEFQTPPSKPSSSMAHNYSRSSPTAGYDGGAGYHAYTPTTPSGTSPQYMSPSDPAKYNAPGSQRNISNTPLGLADIRPRADSSMSDGPPGTVGYDMANLQPGPSNYLAPWALYAFDWCKWAPQGNGAGKLAIGSYLEDGHNFVRCLLPPLAAALLVHHADCLRSKFSIAK
jgi:DDB1- and CUL4-associated factor 7